MKKTNEIMTATSPVTKLWGKRFPIPIHPFPRILSEEITVSTIGHAFGELPPEFSPTQSPLYFVQDFLVDQSQSTGGGSALTDPLLLDLNNIRGYTYFLQAASDRRFQIDLPAGVSSVYFSAWLGRQVTSGLTGGVFLQTPGNVEFEDLAGTPPQITYNSFFMTQHRNEAILFEIEGSITANLGFDSITIQALYDQGSFAPGENWYAPLSYAVPLGTESIYPKSETFVLFGYQTPHVDSVCQILGPPDARKPTESIDATKRSRYSIFQRRQTSDSQSPEPDLRPLAGPSQTRECPDPHATGGLGLAICP
jgi:hypothetical protein